MHISKRKIDIFSPYVLIIVMIIFLIMGYIGSFNYRFKDPLNTQTILTVIYSCIIFLMGILCVRGNFTVKKIDYRIISGRFLLFMSLFALILQSLNMILLGGIPLFNSVLKSNATTNLWRIAYPLFLISVNVLIAKYYDKKYLLLVLLGALIFGLNGYRTSVLGILVSAFINLYYQRKISKKMSVIFILVIIAGLLLTGYVASQSIVNQKWTLNPVELIFHRAAFTLEVLEKIIPLSATTHGHILGMIFSSGSPRTFIGNYVLHYDVCLTPTILGPVLLDFGYVGLTIQMFLMGIFLSVLHKLKDGVGIGLYSVILTHTLIWIETGPTDIMVWFLYLLGLIYIILCVKSSPENLKLFFKKH